MGSGADLEGHTAQGLLSGAGLQDHINVWDMRAVLLALTRFHSLIAHSALLSATDNTTILAYIDKQGGIQFPSGMLRLGFPSLLQLTHSIHSGYPFVRISYRSTGCGSYTPIPKTCIFTLGGCPAITPWQKIFAGSCWTHLSCTSGIHKINLSIPIAIFPHWVCQTEIKSSPYHCSRCSGFYIYIFSRQVFLDQYN